MSDENGHNLIEDEGAGYLVSVSDLMSGLLFIFIIMLVGFILTYTQSQDEPQVDDKIYLAEKEKNEALISAIAKIRKDYILLKSQYDDISKKYERLIRKHTALRQRFDGLEKKHNQLKLSFEEVQKENVRLKNDIHQLLIRLKKLQSERDQLLEELAKSKKILQKKDLRINELEHELDTLRKSIEMFGDFTPKELMKVIQDIEWIQNNLLEFLQELHISSQRSLLAQLAEAAKDKGLLVNIDDKTAVLRLPNIKFQGDTSVDWKSSYENSGAYKEIDRLRMVLEDVLPCFVGINKNGTCDSQWFGSLKMVLIEGHVATRDFTSGFNRTVSKKAITVSTRHAFTLYDDLVGNKDNNLSSMRNRDGELIFSIAGYGDHRPISEETGTYSDSANRRVDLRFIMTTPAISNEIITRIKRLGR